MFFATVPVKIQHFRPVHSFHDTCVRVHFGPCEVNVIIRPCLQGPTWTLCRHPCAAHFCDCVDCRHSKHTVWACSNLVFHAPVKSKTLQSSQPQALHCGEVSFKLESLQTQQWLPSFTFTRRWQEEDSKLTFQPLVQVTAAADFQCGKYVRVFNNQINLTREGYV